MYCFPFSLFFHIFSQELLKCWENTKNFNRTKITSFSTTNNISYLLDFTAYRNSYIVGTAMKLMLYLNTCFERVQELFHLGKNLVLKFNIFRSLHSFEVHSYHITS